MIAERGIGGTGAPATQVAERGIGGTGIIGVVTGFASICLAGHEVALPADVPVEIGGAAAGQQALRAGQVAAVEAGGPANALYARRIIVRYEVQGPIEVIAPDRLQVAGQTVLLSADTWFRTPPALGQWVAVSGLRDSTGAIAATRLDLVSTRTFLLHGVVQQAEGGYRIGTLAIVPGPGDLLVPGLPVSVTGVYGDGMLRGATVAPDLLAADPLAYFGGTTSSFIFEGFAGPAEGGRFFGTLPLSQAPASSRRIGPGRNVVEFRRISGGGIRIDSVVPAAGAGGRFPGATISREGPGRAGAADIAGGRSGRPARDFEPAPVPNRSPGFGAAQGGSGAGARFGNGATRDSGFRRQSGSYNSGGGDPAGGSPGDASAPGPSMEGGGGRRR